MNTLVKMNFQPSIAKDVGTDSAIIYENICYWIAKNEANEKNFHDGKYWTYNSNKAFLKMFTWLTSDKIRTCLKKLKDKKYIETGNYNKLNYDKTLWYSHWENTHWEKSQFDVGEIPNRDGKTPEPIPNYKPDNKHNTLPLSEKKEPIAQAFGEFWKKYPNKKNQSKVATEKKYSAFFKKGGEEWHDKVMVALDNQIKARKVADGFMPEWKHAATWLNQECWDMEAGATEKQYKNLYEEFLDIGGCEFQRKYGKEKRGEMELKFYS